MVRTTPNCSALINFSAPRILRGVDCCPHQFLGPPSCGGTHCHPARSGSVVFGTEFAHPTVPGCGQLFVGVPGAGAVVRELWDGGLALFLRGWGSRAPGLPATVRATSLGGVRDFDVPYKCGSEVPYRCGGVSPAARRDLPRNCPHDQKTRVLGKPEM